MVARERKRGAYVYLKCSSQLTEVTSLLMCVYLELVIIVCLGNGTWAMHMLKIDPLPSHFASLRHFPVNQLPQKLWFTNVQPCMGRW